MSQHRKLGELTVTKSVDWNGITRMTRQTFEICITGPSYPTTPNCKTFGYDGGDADLDEPDPG